MTIDQVLTLAATAVAGFFGAYLATKGKNLADKEDIKRLTETTEGIKRDAAATLKALDYRQQLRMAAIDKRLQAHQEAYRLWSELFETLKASSDPAQNVAAIRLWLNSNCIFLESEVLVAIEKMLEVAMYWHSSGRKGHLKVLRPVFDAGNEIRKAVALPPLRDDPALQSTGSGAS